MTEISATPTRAFRICVHFYSDGECFAVETFIIDLPERQDPQAAAEGLADHSVYHDERVPDLSRTIEITSPDFDDPGPPPASGGASTPV